MRALCTLLLVATCSCTLSGRQPCARDADCADRICADGFCATRSESPLPDAAPSRDAGPRDAGLGVLDAGEPDAGSNDAGRQDAGNLDAGRLDSGTLDSGVDGGPVDAGPVRPFYGNFRQRVGLVLPAQDVPTRTITTAIEVPWLSAFDDTGVETGRFQIYDDSDQLVPYDHEPFVVGQALVLFVRVARGNSPTTLFFAFDPIATPEANDPIAALADFDVVWHFDEPPYRDRVLGLSASTLGSPSQGPGAVGLAVDFNALGDALSATNDNVGEVEVELGSFSTSVWFRFDSTDDFNAIFANGGLDEFSPGYGFEYSSFDDQIYAQIADDGQRRGIAGGAVDATDGAWHHGAMVIDRNLNQLSIYIDGTLTQLVSITDVGSLENNDALIIGAGRNPSNEAFFGGIDELWLTHRALDSAEVRWLAQGVTTVTTGAVEVQPIP